MNKWIGIGNLTRDIELQYSNNGNAVLNNSIAVQRRFKKEGQQEVDFINIVVWGKQAENMANYLTKGSKVAISGRLEVRSYEAKDGTTKYVSEIIADEVEFLSWNSEQNNQSNDLTKDVKFVNDGDIPF